MTAFEGLAAKPGLNRIKESGESVTNHIHLPDRAAASDAADLIARFGIHAADEAANRAAHSRNVGNVIHFCRWRQIERMIVLLSTDGAECTVH